MRVLRNKEDVWFLARNIEYGGWRIVWEVETTPDADLSFSKEGEETITDPATTLIDAIGCSYETEFGGFYVKKADDLKKMISGLRSLIPKKKRRSVKIEDVKTKRLKPLHISDDEEGSMDNEVEIKLTPMPGLTVNSADGKWRISCEALAKLFLVYRIKERDLTLTDCIYTYNKTINDQLDEALQFNFITYLMHGGSDEELVDLFLKAAK